jgi:hypothetical protein
MSLLAATVGAVLPLWAWSAIAQVAVLAEPNLTAGSTQTCGMTSSAKEIVVCGEKGRERSRYRIPKSLVEKPPPTFTRRVVPGTTMSRGVEISATAPCGLFAGQRTCAEAEAAQYGYEKGRDPFTFISKIVKKATGGD